jgi:NADH-quinone oxidoreductase subunit G
VATWKLMVGDGRMQDGDDAYRATARTPVALLSPSTLARLGLVVGQPVTVSAATGSVTLPVAVADLPDDVVWTPTTSRWSCAPGTACRVTVAEGAGA